MLHRAPDLSNMLPLALGCFRRVGEASSTIFALIDFACDVPPGSNECQRDGRGRKRKGKRTEN